MHASPASWRLRRHLSSAFPLVMSWRRFESCLFVSEGVCVFPFVLLPFFPSSFLTLKYRPVFHLMRFSITPSGAVEREGRKPGLNCKLNWILHLSNAVQLHILKAGNFRLASFIIRSIIYCFLFMWVADLWIQTVLCSSLSRPHRLSRSPHSFMLQL